MAVFVLYVVTLSRALLEAQTDEPPIIILCAYAHGPDPIQAWMFHGPDPRHASICLDQQNSWFAHCPLQKRAKLQLQPKNYHLHHAATATLAAAAAAVTIAIRQRPQQQHQQQQQQPSSTRSHPLPESCSFSSRNIAGRTLLIGGQPTDDRRRRRRKRRGRKGERGWASSSRHRGYIFPAAGPTRATFADLTGYRKVGVA